MKSILALLVIVLSSFVPVVGQTIEEIQAEANPVYVDIVDQSPAAQLWRQIVDAKRSEDGALHASLVQEFKQRFPERLSIVHPTSDGPTAIQTHLPPPGDWGSGDVRIYPGGLLQPVGVGSGRNVQLKADSAGNKYAALIISSGDTMLVYKSTNQGLSWLRISAITPGTGTTWHSFDFFVTDSGTVFKIGFAAVRVTSGYAGEIYWMCLNDDGTGFRAVQVAATPGGRGFINPAIVSDGFVKSPETTYWYLVYQNVDATTGVGNAALAGLSMDWGTTWVSATARSGFNDYDLDIEYNDNGDSLHVLLANDLTPTNPNLRLRKVAVANYAGGTWAQYNPATTSLPEDKGCLVMNRQTNEILVTYTLTQTGGDKDIAYAYRTAGSPWVNAAILSGLANSEDRARADCQESQGAYRVTFVSSGASYDTVIYSSSTSLAGGFPTSNRRIVNEQATASTSIYPDVAGFRQNTSSFGGGVVFAGSGSVGAYYDGSNINTSVSSDRGGRPTAFSLEQNYPNPFNPSTIITFGTSQLAAVTLKLYDILGGEVATLVNGDVAAGSHAVRWDGTDGLGRAVAGGVYFCRLQATSAAGATLPTQVRKMVLLK